MKKLNVHISIILILIAWLIFDSQSLKSQSVPIRTPSTSKNITGSTLKMEDAIAKSHVVFVGTITQVGIPSLAGPNQASYSIKFKGLRVLNGSIDIQIPLMLFTDGLSQENPPEAGSSYIFFVKKEPNWNIIRKLLPATDENIAKVTTRIAAGSAGK
jgi:hypothetical protein